MNKYCVSFKSFYEGIVEDVEDYEDAVDAFLEDAGLLNCEVDGIDADKINSNDWYVYATEYTTFFVEAENDEEAMNDAESQYTGFYDEVVCEQVE